MKQVTSCSAQKLTFFQWALLGLLWIALLLSIAGLRIFLGSVEDPTKVGTHSPAPLDYRQFHGWSR